MFNIVKDMEDPHVEQVFSLYGSPNDTYDEQSWGALHTSANIHIQNLLVKTFIQAVDQFRTEVGVKRCDLKKVPLADKFVVCSVLTGIYLDNWELPSNRWTGHQIQLENILMAFTGIDPTHLADIEYIRSVAKDRPGIELTVRIRMNIKPESGVKYMLEPEEWNHV
jgi:hypothetical protein